MIRIAFVTAAAYAALVLGRASALAAVCDCPPVPGVEQAYTEAAAVFSGTVLSVESGGTPQGYPSALVHPIERWKGVLRDDPIPVVTLPGCEFPFVVGQDYLFYTAMIDIGVTHYFVPFVTLCTRTATLAGNPDLDYLGPSVLPVPARAGTWGTLKSLYR